MRTFDALLGLQVLITASPTACALVKSTPVPGDDDWDDLTVDAAAWRVDVSHGNQIEVVDADSKNSKGTIANTRCVRGIALDLDHGRGFTKNGPGGVPSILDNENVSQIIGMSLETPPRDDSAKIPTRHLRAAAKSVSLCG